MNHFARPHPRSGFAIHCNDKQEIEEGQQNNSKVALTISAEDFLPDNR
jgi:hypothetical protein